MTKRADIRGLVALVGTTQRRTVGFWAHCMLEKSSKNLPRKIEVKSAYNDPTICEISVLQDAGTWRAVIFPVGSTIA